MKMKLIVTAVAVFVGVLNLLLPWAGPIVVLAAFGTYLLLGIARSSSRGLDPLNDVPNAFRVLLAALSPTLAFAASPPWGAYAAGLAFLAAVLLNDEYQRRALDSFRKGRVGGSVALLGIDGSGKSTHAAELENWFRSRGYYCTRVPFHRYLFVERLSPRRRTSRPSGSRRSGNPLRPLLSAVDNLALNLTSSFGRGLEGRIVLYDRYIWSTFVKYEALGYPVRPLRWLYMLPRPKFALVLDIPVARSLAVVQGRPDHIRYQRDILEEERQEYLRIAKETGFPVVDATRSYSAVQSEIERKLAAVFPNVGGGG